MLVVVLEINNIVLYKYLIYCYKFKHANDHKQHSMVDTGINCTNSSKGNHQKIVFFRARSLLKS